MAFRKERVIKFNNKLILNNNKINLKVKEMTSKILEVENDEIIDISGTKYVRIPKGFEKSIGITNFDGSKTSKQIKRAKIQGKHGVFMGVWGTFQSK